MPSASELARIEEEATEEKQSLILPPPPEGWIIDEIKHIRLLGCTPHYRVKLMRVKDGHPAVAENHDLVAAMETANRRTKAASQPRQFGEYYGG